MEIVVHLLSPCETKETFGQSNSINERYYNLFVRDPCHESKRRFNWDNYRVFSMLGLISTNVRSLLSRRSSFGVNVFTDCSMTVYTERARANARSMFLLVWSKRTLNRCSSTRRTKYSKNDVATLVRICVFDCTEYSSEDAYCETIVLMAISRRRRSTRNNDMNALNNVAGVRLHKCTCAGRTHVYWLCLFREEVRGYISVDDS